MTLVAVNLGSNYNANVQLDAAILALSKRAQLHCSARYVSPAVGLSAAAFYNQSIYFDSHLTHAELLRIFKQIENQLGREQYRQQPDIQPIDIDFLLYNQTITDVPPLPHPDILKHAHVLCPLSEILPNFVHPTTGQSLQQHWQAMQITHQPDIKKVAQ